MSDENNLKPQGVLSAYDDAAKNNALIAYVLMILGYFTGILWFIGAIWVFIKQSDADRSQFNDHYSNILTVFCWSFVLRIIGFLLSFILIGYPILFFVWLWSLYRIIKGVANLTSNKSYDDITIPSV